MMVPTINGRPVLLPPHEHDKFGDPGLHYHIDFRYTDREPRQDDVVFSEAEPVYKNLEQVKRIYKIVSKGFEIPLYLSEIYKGQKSNCNLCPHKNLPIMNGVCVGHSLSFSKDGNVCSELYVVLNDMKQKAIFGKNQYEFYPTNSGVLNFIKLINEYDTEVAKINLGGDYYHKGDKVSITLKSGQS